MNDPTNNKGSGADEAQVATCARCNNIRVTSDLGVMNGVPLCHGAFDIAPTCYQRTVLESSSKHPKHFADRPATTPHDSEPDTQEGDSDD